MPVESQNLFNSDKIFQEPHKSIYNMLEEELAGKISD